MVTINLTHGFFIEREGVDHVLKREVMTKPTKRSPEPHKIKINIGYFSSLKNALERYLLIVQSEGANGLELDINGYVDAVELSNDLTIKQITKLVGAE